MATIDVIKGRYPHVGWVDLEGQGILTEIAIVKNGADGLYFMKLNSMDAIDKQRLFRVISNRNAHLYELWDLMSNITLGNGANSLEYFHQYVKVLTPSGKIITPQIGRRSAPVVPPRVAPKATEVVTEDAAEKETASKTTTRKTTTKK